jgi:AraC-like DNA-binding protein
MNASPAFSPDAGRDALSDLLRAVQVRRVAPHRRELADRPPPRTAPAAQPGDLLLVLHGANPLLVDVELAGAPAGNAGVRLECELPPAHPLLNQLPDRVHLPAARRGPWIAPLLEQAAVEAATPSPGGQAVLERLAEMMLVDALRRHLEAAAPAGSAWLAGLRDRYVSRALALMHDRPDHPWTVDDLGRRIGLSRSALHERFQRHLGQGPSQYLARWRIQVGSRLLRESCRSVASIAQDVGYDSEAAFSRAFKRVVGRPPAAWRKSLQAA